MYLIRINLTFSQDETLQVKTQFFHVPVNSEILGFLALHEVLFFRLVGKKLKNHFEVFLLKNCIYLCL